MSEQTRPLPEEKQFYAYIDCLGIDPTVGAASCGTVGLTETQYERQLNDPDRPWRCPKCGATAEYNDTLSEKAQGVSESEWTLEEGIALCTAIQNLPSQKFHCHPALTGGLLYRQPPRKDCDIVIYQRGDVDGKRESIDWIGLWTALEQIGLCLINDFGYVKKCTYKGKSVDIFDPTDENSEYGAQADADPDLAMEAARDDKPVFVEVEDDLLF